MSEIIAHPTSGLLPALVGYYERLEADPEQEVAAFGTSWQKIAFQVVLEADGSLHAINDVREAAAKTKRPTMMLVPGQGKPPGQGINPCFLWDNGRYMLGFKPEDDDADRTRRCFEAFRQRHLSAAADIDDADYAAVAAFLKGWQPERAAEVAGLAELAGGFGTFRVRAAERRVDQRPAVRRWWESQVAETAAGDVPRGRSLVSGASEPLARLHEPKIKGVIGGQSSGGVIVGFNDSAYESHGKSQSFNAPVGVADADKYAKALNRLLADDARRLRIGDATVVFWADAPPAAAKEATDWFGEMLGESGGNKAESQPEVDQLKESLVAVKQGRMPGGISGDTPFYVLGLSPNASRVNVRFWLPSTLGALARRLAEHHARLEMVGQRPGDPPLMIRTLLLETARDPKDIPPQLAGQLARAVLGGTRYPQSLLDAVVRRVRVSADVNHRKAAILKAVLIRNHNQEVPVALQLDHPDEAYQLGRLFAALEKTQEDVSPGLNKTIKDSYFGAASSTPASVFPRLLRLHQFHVEKYDNPGRRVAREKLVGEICGHISQFPRHLPLERQGLFHIAYYHQRQDFFTKKSDKPAAEMKETSDE